MSGGWRIRRGGPMSPDEISEALGCAIYYWIVGIIALALFAFVEWRGLYVILGATGASIGLVLTAIAAAALWWWGPRWHHTWQSNRYAAYCRRVRDGQHPTEATEPWLVRFWGAEDCSYCGARFDRPPSSGCEVPDQHRLGDAPL